MEGEAGTGESSRSRIRDSAPRSATEAPSSDPLVSVVMATWNRSNIVGYSIESLRRNTIQDWELLVIGDACTDDTARVVEGLADARIRFHNLATNCGEQSGPNNEGLRRARGRYIAFLNHDDLWTADHLEVCLDTIRQGAADLVFTLSLAVLPDDSPVLLGAMPGGRYHPHLFVPASSWLARREAMLECGPWRLSRQCHAAPSQDWLFRAWRRGMRLQPVPRVTVVAIQSGARDRAYERREERIHARTFERLVNDAGFLADEVTRAACAAVTRSEDLGIRAPLMVLARNLVYRMTLVLRLNPQGLLMALLHGRKGAFVERLRRNRGLPAAPGVDRS